MDTNTSQTVTQVRSDTTIGTRIGAGVILGLGVALLSGYLMSGFMFLTQDDRQATVRYELSPTTCGTYTDPDGGQNQPFVKSGQHDTDCVVSANEPNVCHLNTDPGCLLGTPTPPTVSLTGIEEGYFFGQFGWYSDLPSRMTTWDRVSVIKDDPQVDEWLCFYGMGLSQEMIQYCNNYMNIFLSAVTDDHTTHHVIEAVFTYPGVYYFTVRNETSNGIVLKSEIRKFTVTQNSITQ